MKSVGRLLHTSVNVACSSSNVKFPVTLLTKWEFFQICRNVTENQIQSKIFFKFHINYVESFPSLFLPLIILSEEVAMHSVSHCIVLCFNSLCAIYTIQKQNQKFLCDQQPCFVFICPISQGANLLLSLLLMSWVIWRQVAPSK